MLSHLSNSSSTISKEYSSFKGGSLKEQMQRQNIFPMSIAYFCGFFILLNSEIRATLSLFIICIINYFLVGLAEVFFLCISDLLFFSIGNYWDTLADEVLFFSYFTKLTVCEFYLTIDFRSEELSLSSNTSFC